MVEIILFFSSFFPGVSINLVPSKVKINFDFTLVFSGSYILALTMMHIIPEVFSVSKDVHTTGLFILIGFFSQTLLELLLNDQSNKIEKSYDGSPLMLILGLCVHAFFEASLLYSGNHHLGHATSSNLLIGIVMHRIPVTIALVTILKNKFNTTKTIIGLTVFSLASPLGLMATKLTSESAWMNNEYLNSLNAFVAGGFLHVALDIFHGLHSNDEKGLNKKRIGWTITGVSLAIIVEYFL